MESFCLQPFFLFEPDQGNDDDQNTDNDDDRISPWPVQFRHVDKVHAVPAGNQRQRHEDRRDHSQKGHNIVLLDAQFAGNQIAQLGDVIPQLADGILQTLDPLREQAEIAQVFLGEKLVFVCFELSGYIDQTFLVCVDIKKIAADIVQ